jgi:hypothetical protein
MLIGSVFMTVKGTPFAVSKIRKVMMLLLLKDSV